MEATTTVEFPLYILKMGQGGMTWIDLFLIVLCPLAGLLGTVVSSVMQKKQIAKESPEDMYIKTFSSDIFDEKYDEKKDSFYVPYEEFIDRKSKLATRGNNIVGLALGLVVALYFFGAITQDFTSLARLVGLCILLGYQAPNIWSIQEKVISNIADKKILEAINSAGSSPKK